MKTKRSITLLISGVLGLAYSIYIIVYFSGAITGSTGAAETAGAAIATALVTPHMVLVVLATIFNWVGYLTNKKAFALTGAILYSVGGVIFLLYIVFVIPSIILSFIGFSQLNKINELNKVNMAEK